MDNAVKRPTSINTATSVWPPMSSAPSRSHVQSTNDREAIATVAPASAI
jgi:hypothetical protein